MWWDVDEERRNRDEGCVFCKIVDGSLPSREVYSDETVYAFHDVSPVAKVHVLIVPRRHLTALTSARAEHDSLLGHMMRAAAEVAKKTSIAGSGYRVSINQGIDAGQVVDHLHLHVLGGEKLYPLGELSTGTEG
jgi:histidine triad (HIT) family protein